MTIDAGARRHALPIGLLFLAVLVAFQDVIGPERGLFYRDHLLVFKPEWYAIKQSLLSGELPALTRASTAGVPVEHILNCTYAPLTLFILFGDFEVMYDVFVAAHFLLLAAGVYALAIALGARRAEALIAAAVMTLSGPVLSLENLLRGLQAMAYAPWVLLAFHRVLIAPRLRNAALLALAVFFEVQGLVPEVLVLDLIAAGAIAVFVRPRVDARLFAMVCGGAILGLMLSSIVLGPALEVLPLSRRGRGFGYEEQSGWRLTALGFLEFFAPSLFAPREIPFINVPAATGAASDPPFFESLYLGSVVAVALCARRGRRQAIVLLAIAFFLLMAMGKATPLHRLVSALPILRSTRYAVKYTLLVAALVAVLAPLSLRGIEAHPRRLALLASLQAVLLLVFRFVAGTPEVSELLSTSLQGWGLTPEFQGIASADFAGIAQAAMRHHIALSIAAPVLLAGLAVLASRPSFAARLDRLAPLVALVVTFDLALAATHTIRGANVEAERPPIEAVAAIAGDEDGYVSYTPERYPPIAHHEGRSYFEDLIVSYGKRCRNLFQGVRRYLDFDTDALSNLTHAYVFDRAARARPADFLRLMARLGVARVVTWSPDLPLPEILSYAVPGEDPERIYRVPGVVPYAKAYASWRPVPKDRLFEGLVDPENAETALLAEAPPDIAARTATACASSLVTTVAPHDGPSPVTVETQGVCEAMVVLREIRMPGWTARLDGAEAPLYEAEAGYLAARVPEGRHTVTFEYRPLLRRYLPIALLGLVGLVLAFALDLTRRSKAPRPFR